MTRQLAQPPPAKITRAGADTQQSASEVEETSTQQSLLLLLPHKVTELRQWL